jgi:hypothetical protein
MESAPLTSLFLFWENKENKQQQKGFVNVAQSKPEIGTKNGMHLHSLSALAN